MRKHLFALLALLPLFSDLTTYPNDTYVELEWDAISKAPLNMIRRSVKNFPETPQEGDLAYLGNGTAMRGVMADRNLENGVTYYYTLFSLNSEGRVENMDHKSATPLYLGKKNLVFNGDFYRELTGWNSSGVPIKKGPFGNAAHILPNTHISQKLRGLKPKTLYTCSVKFFTERRDSVPTFSVSGTIQQEKQLRSVTSGGTKEYGFGPLVWSEDVTAMTGKWVEKRFVFWTTEQTDVTLTLSLAKEASASGVFFSDVQVIEGLMPYFSPGASKPYLGQNLIVNPGFNGAPPTPWELHRASLHNVKQQVELGAPLRVVVLHPTEKDDAYVKQTLPYTLLGSTRYQMIVWIKTPFGKKATLSLIDGDGELFAQEIEGDGQWHHYVPDFVTPSNGATKPALYFVAKAGEGEAMMQMPVLPATGREFSPKMPEPPKPQLSDASLFLSDMRILDVHGSREGNAHAEEDAIVITAFGNAAPRDKRFTGAILASRGFYGSGKYAASVKFGGVFNANGDLDRQYKERGPEGCIFTFGPFNMRNYAGSDLPQEFDAPSPIRKAKVGIDFSGMVSTWGGQRGGLTGGVELLRKPPGNVDLFDGAWHRVAIEWNSGRDLGKGRREPGVARWYLDGKLWGEWEGANYGFDNVPFVASELHIGAFFPKNNEKLPPWYKAKFYVRDVMIEPSSSTHRDVWMPPITRP